jgi:hypothetical protein
MQKKTLETYTLDVARDRLQLNPGWLERFESELASNEKLADRLDEMFSPMERGYLTARELWPTKRLRIQSFVDSWTDCQPEAQITQSRHAVAEPKSEPADATPQPASDAHKQVSTADAPLPMKKAALIAAHKNEWPTIERDISDAATNGLAAAAKAGERDWFEENARKWARVKGKLKIVNRPVNSLAQGVNSMVNLPGRKHTS